MHPIDSVSFGAIVQVRDMLMAQQATGKKVFRLESGDPNFSIPATAREGILMALEKGHTHYTESTGIKPLREALLHKLNRDNELSLKSPDDVIVTNGGMHALYLTFSALIDPGLGQEVIMPDPMWTEIGENIKLAGGIPVRVPMNLESNHPYSAEIIEKYITKNTKAIFLNTPHNPTGVVLKSKDLEQIALLAQKHNLTIISDEAYEHVIFDGLTHVSIGRFAPAKGRTISLYSMSKSYAMSGLRLGYLASEDKVFLDRVKKLLRCTTNGVNSLAQWAALYAINGSQMVVKDMASEYQRRRDILFSALNDSGLFTPVFPSGSFFMWAKLNSGLDWDVTNYLIGQYGLGSSPGSAFGETSTNYLRFSFSSSTDSIEQASDIIRKL